MVFLLLPVVGGWLLRFVLFCMRHILRIQNHHELISTVRLIVNNINMLIFVVDFIFFCKKHMIAVSTRWWGGGKTVAGPNMTHVWIHPVT